MFLSSGISNKRAQERSKRHRQYCEDVQIRRSRRVTYWSSYIIPYVRFKNEIKWYVTCYLLESGLLPSQWDFSRISSVQSFQTQLDDIGQEIYNSCFRQDDGRVQVLDHMNPNFNNHYGEIHGYNSTNELLILNIDSGRTVQKNVHIGSEFVESVARPTTDLPKVLSISVTVPDYEETLSIPVVFDMGLFSTITRLHPSPQECHPKSFPAFAMMLSSKRKYVNEMTVAAEEEESQFLVRLESLKKRRIEAIELHLSHVRRPFHDHPNHRRHPQYECPANSPGTPSLLDDIMGLDHLFTLPFCTTDGSLADCSDNLLQFGDMSSSCPKSERKECDIIKEIGNDLLVINQSTAVSVCENKVEDVVIDLCLKW